VFTAAGGNTILYLILKQFTMEDENITRQESLAIIESMINKAKNQFSENGFAYLLWGWVILLCSTSQFILQHLLHYPKYYLVWMLTWLALLIQFFYYGGKKRKRKVRTYTGEIIGYVWLTFVIMLFLSLALIDSALQPAQEYLSTVVILILYGMPTFLSGIILKFKPLIAGGIGCWVLSIVTVLLPHDFSVLVISVAVVAAWIIPGYLLRNRYKKENQPLFPAIERR
jgi:FtsH-binding integral membrane protein